MNSLSFTDSTPTLTIEELRSIAKRQNLDVFGATNSAPLDHARGKLESWQVKDYAGEMQYMKRSSELLSNPASLLESARSVVVFGIAYDRRPSPECPKGYGRVARYAWGKDYHLVLKRSLEAFFAEVEQVIGKKIEARIFSDSVPLLERSLAERAGIGFIGKNSMLIRPGSGSYLFLAEILWNVEIRSPLQIVDASCGTCSRCMPSCPTGAIVEERTLDARRCISYLTIEKRGVLSQEERGWIGEWLFGCDVCQDVCPFNAAPLKRESAPALSDFGFEEGAGPLVSLEKLLSIRTDEEFRARFSGTPLLRPKRAGLLRNGAVVAANTNAEALGSILETCVLEDPSPLVRLHALWANCTLYRTCNNASAKRVRDLAERSFMLDSSDDVREEARSLLESGI